jgi:hypothetical protein
MWRGSLGISNANTRVVWGIVPAKGITNTIMIVHPIQGIMQGGYYITTGAPITLLPPSGVETI